MNILKITGNKFFLGILLCAVFFSFICSASADSEITATKVDSFADSNSNGKVEVGETIEYTITIENTGNEDATNINLEDILSPNLAMVPNSVVVAKDDIFDSVGNTNLEVDSENGVLANDLDPDNTALAVTHLNGNTNLSGLSTNGGEVQMTEDGSFIYVPAAGFRGPTDTFIYTVKDGNGNSANARVIINISEIVWFVDNKAQPGGDGRSFSPFNSLAFLNDPNDVDEPGDFIFIFEGMDKYNGGLKLEAGQKLIGQGADLVVSGKTLQAATNPPTLADPNGDVITLAGDNEISGIIIDFGNGHGIFGKGISGGVILANTNITGNTGDGIRLVNMINVTIDLDDLSIRNNAGHGVALIEVTGTLTMDSTEITGNGGAGLYLDDSVGNGSVDLEMNGTTLEENAGSEIQVVGGAPDIDYTGDITKNSGYLVDIANTIGGTQNFAFSTFNGTGGTGIRLTNVNSYVNVDGTVLGGSRGIDIQGGSGMFNFTNSHISGLSGTAFSLSNSSAKVTYSGNITNNSGGLIEIDTLGSGGNVDFTSGTVTADTGSDGINILNSEGDVSFKAYIAGSEVNPLTADAINLVNNTGNITFEDISLYTSGADGIFADSGALNVGNGSVTSSAGAAVDIDYTLINMNLTAISSTNSPIQGIDLTNLAAGSVMNVSGRTAIDNSADKGIRIDKIGPGGDIDFAEVEIANRNEIGLLIKDAQGKVDYGHTAIPNPGGAGGYGIRVEGSSADITFASVDISDTRTTISQSENTGIPVNEGNGDGIFLINNTGSFTLNGGTIDNCDGDGIDIRKSSNINLNNLNIINPGNDGIQAIDMTGTNTVSGCAITRFVNHGNANGITVYGTKAGSMSLTISSTQFSNEDQDGGNAGIFLEARSNYQATLVVDDAGGLVNDSVFEKISGSAVVTAAIDSSIVTTRIRDSIFRNAHGVLGNNAIEISSGGSSTAGFIVENNILDTLMRASTFAGTVGFSSTSSSKITGKIRNNDLDDTRGSAYGSIISGLSNPALDVTINNNYADDVARYGLRVRLDETASGIVRASGNQLGTVGPVGNDSSTRDGIEIRSRDNTGDYYVSLKNNQAVTNGSIGKAIDIDSEDNAAIYLDVSEGNIFRNDGGGRDFDAETEDPGSEICLKLTGHTFGTFDLTETAGNFEIESLITIHIDNPGATIYIGSGVESTPGCPIHPAEPADP